MDAKEIMKIWAKSTEIIKVFENRGLKLKSVKDYMEVENDLISILVNDKKGPGRPKTSIKGTGTPAKKRRGRPKKKGIVTKLFGDSLPKKRGPKPGKKPDRKPGRPTKKVEAVSPVKTEE